MPTGASLPMSPAQSPCDGIGWHGCGSRLGPPTPACASSISSASTTEAMTAWDAARRPRYPSGMRTELEGRPAHTPVLRKAAAGVVLIVAVVIAIKLVIGLVTAVLWTVVAAAVVIAVLWALKTLVW